MKLPTIPPGLAGKIVKNCPLLERIRLQDFEDSAPSQAQKKIKHVIFTCEDIKFSRESSLGISLVFI